VVSKSVVTVCCFKEMVPYWVSWVLMAENREMVVSLDFFKKHSTDTDTYTHTSTHPRILFPRSLDLCSSYFLSLQEWGENLRS
jgi:hypothetical protein